MRKALEKIGSDVVLVLDSAMRDALKLHDDDGEGEVEVELRSGELIVHPVDPQAHDAVGEAFQRVVEHPNELESIQAAETEGMPPSQGRES